MKLRHIAAVSALTAVFLCLKTGTVWGYAPGNAPEGTELVDMIPGYVNMETEPAGEDPLRLYALSAVLMDGESGRVLYEKEGSVPRANASTTKVLTCILALENASMEDIVTVSANAAAQPDVQLTMREGEQYYLKDLLYSLMLKSHNDTAVALAEHIGGSVEGFARLMNRKAAELGCLNTHFVTPNGLDASDGGGSHRTTARDLALLMRYAIGNPRFLAITQTMDYSFSDVSGKRSFSIHNANALLERMDGLLSGKTGYTGEAGYCYVCAWEKGGRTFIVSLLGCGWPNNKTYKWSDTEKLLSYGDSNYELRSIWREPGALRIPVEEGAPEDGKLGETVYLRGVSRIPEGERQKKLLMKEGERIEYRVMLPKSLRAPVKKGRRIGEILYLLDGEKISSYPVFAERSVEKITYLWVADKIFHDYFH